MGDTTLVTLDWLKAVPGNLLPHPVALYRSERMVWEPLDGWAEKRRVNLFQLDEIKGMPGRGW